MAYRTLKAQFHASGAVAADDLHAHRLASESTLVWDFEVGDFPAFCVLTTEMVKLQERVFVLDRKVAALWSQIPKGASIGYLNTLLIREIEATNDIEQVRSTRKEISDALKAKLGEPGHKKRFQELARLYSALANGVYDLPSSPAEIRTIYDAIVDGEIEDDHQVDGPLFRLETTRITSGTKVVHEAVPVGEIEQRINAVLQLLHKDDAPGLVAAMASHFMFEYIHPFYDGNGRTGRFLLAQKLQAVVSPLAAMALSPVINQQKDRYYKAFENAEHPLNKGDLTPFVTGMLELLLEAQGEMLRDLEARQLLFDDLKQHIERRPATSAVEERHNRILFILGQVWLFDDMRSIDQDSLSSYFKETKQTIRKDLGVLEDQGLVEVVTQRPKTFTLSELACQELGLIK
ncbi:Adenosine monophosphate-protein transferase SoFic [Corynebacterium kalinowskii]|uniref:Adenosine monophosphate-protein transferase SoFic n=1 Tax=Corynebacterium kalinowskii TaxID=2675216 RepID=A0A6B8VWC8_9CORY|nr:Fic family protein [Corynebacterium kalinowskii]QGU03235.1 Adenosine monophosphate-protein transferase SoFic [Corynebacterium kalinowskii]